MIALNINRLKVEIGRPDKKARDLKISWRSKIQIYTEQKITLNIGTNEETYKDRKNICHAIVRIRKPVFLY